jgi:hypothetical protein
VTVADALAVPPNPVQARPKVLVLVNVPVDSLPEFNLAPDQPPEAVQEVALVDDQVSVEDPQLAADLGFAASDTVGTGGGGGVPPWLLWELSPPPQAAIMRHRSRRPNERITVPHVPAELDTETIRSISFPRRR